MLCGCEEDEDIEYFPGQQVGESYDETLSEQESMEESMILVYVCGAVKEPGVVEIASDARVVDAIALAGGMTAEAEKTYINLASRLSDGEKIYVPTRSEAEQWILDEEKGKKININTADVDMLCQLSGIGESRAEDIISYRKKHGEFRTTEELMKVPGIKENLFEKIKDKITVGE